jgi:hypothetical protein
MAIAVAVAIVAFFIITWIVSAIKGRSEAKKEKQ